VKALRPPPRATWPGRLARLSRQPIALALPLHFQKLESQPDWSSRSSSPHRRPAQQRPGSGFSRLGRRTHRPSVCGCLACAALIRHGSGIQLPHGAGDVDVRWPATSCGCPGRESPASGPACFVDYGTGIHWSQCQMQSGQPGHSTRFRLYNQSKTRGQDHDPRGNFIRQWATWTAHRHTGCAPA